MEDEVYEADMDAVWQCHHPGQDLAFDAYGYLIARTAPEGTPLAWEVDHIFPKKHLKTIGVGPKKIDHPDNLRLIHHSVNSAKRDNYPFFATKRLFWYNALHRRPPFVEQPHVVPVRIQARLLNLYADEIERFLLKHPDNRPLEQEDAGDTMAALNAIWTSRLCIRGYSMLMQRLSPNLAGLLQAFSEHAWTY